MPLHPNALKFEGFDRIGNLVAEKVYYSVGGGIVKTEDDFYKKNDVYPSSAMEEVLDWCESNGRSLWEFVEINEGIEIWDYLKGIWKVMEDSISRSLRNEGVLLGKLHLPRKAWSYYIKAINSKKQTIQ
jgi:L-serine dehydratase